MMHKHEWEKVEHKPCQSNEFRVELRCKVCSARKFVELSSSIEDVVDDFNARMGLLIDAKSTLPIRQDRV